ncbi:MAG: hypothetical protein HWQ41_00470 [Nostoc sp. NOS(2021)]|uniref:hypothetical protein n=1 Tax=Nostoc sp. NOS(2021) TaxID=2815407 RepID=UPI0025FB393B|nr:hypothetical protein [Nostoc sp. NOS(2021)]MBN3893818.1 hypothetical protein [Nostoc sp. NOS(2021)]
MEVFYGRFLKTNPQFNSSNLRSLPPATPTAPNLPTHSRTRPRHKPNNPRIPYSDRSGELWFYPYKIVSLYQVWNFYLNKKFVSPTTITG